MGDQKILAKTAHIDVGQWNERGCYYNVVIPEGGERFQNMPKHHRRVSDAVVGRGNAGWTTSKSGELLTRAFCTKD